MNFRPNEASIYSDKIKLSQIAVTKELDLIENYNSLYKKIKQKELTLDELNQCEHFFFVWKNLIELYHFLEFNSALKWGKEKENEKNYDQLKETINKYRSIDDECSFHELTFAFDMVRKIMEFSGFHDVARDSSKYDENDFGEEDDGMDTL